MRFTISVPLKSVFRCRSAINPPGASGFNSLHFFIPDRFQPCFTIYLQRQELIQVLPPRIGATPFPDVFIFLLCKVNSYENP